MKSLSGKFLRAELLRLGGDEHILILATHHIVSDAWSMGILTRELWALYQAVADDEASRIARDLPVQYSDFRSLAEGVAARRGPRLPVALLEKAARPIFRF